MPAEFNNNSPQQHIGATVRVNHLWRPSFLSYPDTSIIRHSIATTIMQTFWIQTLGCKVNQYESEQIATLLRQRGLTAGPSPDAADLHVINTCSVTIQASSKSRQTIRRATRLKVLDNSVSASDFSNSRPRKTILTGCWATSNRVEALDLPGVDAVLTHADDVAGELHQLLDRWGVTAKPSGEAVSTTGDTSSDLSYGNSKPHKHGSVKPILAPGTRSLPLLGDRQTGHQRAFLKIQDGCDAHCTYCIIPRLRTNLWSKPIDDTLDEARRLVDSGHVELVLTGIFLGAYGQPTALRHRQPDGPSPLGRLVEALCTRVPGLHRLRFSSLEPGDLSPELLQVLRSQRQVVPHFHLPLQSGSDRLLHRMNRQYTRSDFLRMIDDVHAAFDRPAITTDIIVGFPGETDQEFGQTLDVVDRVKFIHTHAFSFSPRPGTAAARWSDDFVHGPVVNERINLLTDRSATHSLEYRSQFVGLPVELLVEHPKPFETLRHGRCERYFDVHLEASDASPGDLVRAVIARVSPSRTFATVA